MSKSPLTPQTEDFPRWYQDVISKAQLAENGPVRGTMVIRPYAYAIWERMSAAMDHAIKEAGAENVYFPLFIPESYLQREAQHVEGFSPELAVVTHAGGKALEEPIVVRPTSETVIGEYMAKWVQSYRDLPLLLNQWANVVRWELRPRLFLRTTEFLWQEGHTAHASQQDAAAYAAHILHQVYAAVMEEELAVPVIRGRKPTSERFAGAINTLATEAMMRDGKALQMGTSHELGQNFARAFGMQFLDESGVQQHCWTTSWGTSTRMMGGLFMAHGDDRGLVIPPRVAGTQAVILIVRDDDSTVERWAGALRDELAHRGIRAKVDSAVNVGFGRRATDWEIKGVPLRIEVGPRDVANGTAVVVRRDTAEKASIGREVLVQHVVATCEEIQRSLFERALSFQRSRTHEVDTLEAAIEAAGEGFAILPWREVGSAGEALLAERALTVRCLLAADGGIPGEEDLPGNLAVIARSY